MNALQTAFGALDLAATVVLAGGILYAAVIAAPTPRGRGWIARAVLAIVVALVAEFVLTAYRMGQLSGVSGSALVVKLLGTRWGRLWVTRALGLGVLAVPITSGSTTLAIAAALWLVPRSFQGHAGAHGTLPAVIDWLHLLAAAAWLGGLVQLASIPDPVPIGLARRYRALATGALGLLVPAGIYAAFLHVPNVRALIGSPYGRTLVAKLALVAGLLALGAASHFRHVPALGRGDATTAARLKRTVAAEIGLAAGVLVLSALLGVLPMPHQLGGPAP